MTNEIIGIASVFAVTIFLFVLRRLILPSERRSERRSRHDRAFDPPSRSALELKKGYTEDDAWLWNPDLSSNNKHPPANQQPVPLRGERRNDDEAHRAM